MRTDSLGKRAGVLVAATSLVLAACGAGDDDNVEIPEMPSLEVTSGQILNPSDKRGGTLVALNDSDCDYWDPQRTYYAYCWTQQRWISRTLLTYKPSPGDIELVGDLATAPAESEDMQTWTYTLKEGIKFEDGTSITSKDIKYGIERVFATDVINGGPTYVIDYLQTDPPYKGPYTDPTADKLGLRSIETPDDKTIVFHLNKPFPDWNYIMASPAATPVPRAKDTGDRYTARPVASGPYKIEEYVPNEKMILVRNDHWDPATDEVNQALPDRIEIQMGLDLPDVDERILAGDGDVYVAQSGVQLAAQSRLISDPALLNDRAAIDLTGFLRYLSVTTTVEPFDDIHCRRAVAWAIDKQAQVLARGGPAGGEVATTMLPPVLKYYSEFDLYPTPDSRGDIARAKEELAACGYPDGFRTKLASRNNDKEVAQAEAVQASLAQIGIEVEIEQFEPSVYYSALLGIPANMREQGFGLALAGWKSDWPSAYGFFSSIVDGRKILEQGNSNYAELNDPVVNQGIDDGATATDDAAAQEAWTTVDRAVVESAAYIPLVYEKALNVYSDRLTNVYFSRAYGMANFAALGVIP